MYIIRYIIISNISPKACVRLFPLVGYQMQVDSPKGAGKLPLLTQGPVKILNSDDYPDALHVY
jgi:hypothetical protein